MENFASEHTVSAQPGGKLHYVFVYGTLKDSFGNHHRLKDNDAEMIGYGQTKDTFVMFNTGGYPVVIAFPVSEADRAPVGGELYAVNDKCLRSLDALEGNGSLFIRNYYDIELLDGSVIPAYMYTGVQAAWENFTRTNKQMFPDDTGVIHWSPYKGKRNAA